eukprot:GEMP01019822.1.p1 GENE.GEMP01019822.1~~GEMP01019822.1.p1  ORF type:complete len:355 (+),score=63.23 GEMP01019822.1:25-1065(+)
MSAGGLQLRLKVQGATVVLSELKDDLTLRGLKEELAKTTHAPWYHHVLNAGFPPREVMGSDDQSVRELNLHKEAILVTNDPSRQGDSEPAQYRKREQLDAQGDPSVKKAKAKKADAAAPSDPSASPSRRFSDRIEIQRFPEPMVLPSDFLGAFSRQVILADNSCLFNSIKEACHLDITVAELRAVIAKAVEVDDRFDDVVLEKPLREYIQWIQKPESWGGYIECLILAEYLQVQIASIHVQTSHIAYYPEDYAGRYCIYLLHDGIHYDYVKAEGPDKTVISVFAHDDDLSLARATSVAGVLKDKKQFTDVHGFSIQCQECFTPLKGQKEMQEHGQQTGHRNFAEVG